MKLVSFGCSFIVGNDLADDRRPTPTKTLYNPSLSTWPALISKRLGFDYSSRALAGIGNLRILESIITESAIATDSFFVIGWSWIDRFDYTIDNDIWQTLRPTVDTPEADQYYRNLHSQYRDKLTSLVHIRTAIDILQQKNIPFVMTYMDELIFETKWHCSPAISQLQDYITPYLTTFDGNSFLDWSTKLGFPISQNLHPLEAAHAAAADLLFPAVESKLIAFNC
jgi:hypothetical protein